MKTIKFQNFYEIKSFYLEALVELGVQKSDIKEMSDEDVACKCPICGDSRIGNKKRLHLYKKGEVINVNCFNGDCPAKNMTPWNFFKSFAPRTFHKFRDSLRGQFLKEIMRSGNSGNPETEDYGESGDWEKWEKWISNESNNLDNPNCSNNLDNPNDTKILEVFIENFTSSNNFKNDLLKIKTFLSENKEVRPLFKSLMES